jgi:chaperonin GroES
MQTNHLIPENWVDSLCDTPEKGAQRAMAKVKVKPLADRILVKRLEVDEAKVGSIYIPDTAKEKPQQAKVIAVGPGKVADDGSRVALEVSVGDTVLIGKYSGTDVKLGGEDHLIIREDDVLAIVG